MPHGKIIVVLVAILFVAAVLRSLERSCTAIVDHPVVVVLRPFRLTTLVSPAFLSNPIIPAVSGPSCFSGLCVLRPPF